MARSEKKALASNGSGRHKPVGEGTESMWVGAAEARIMRCVSRLGPLDSTGDEAFVYTRRC
jgi:hypothetical protein